MKRSNFVPCPSPDTCMSGASLRKRLLKCGRHQQPCNFKSHPPQPSAASVDNVGLTRLGELEDFSPFEMAEMKSIEMLLTASCKPSTP